MRKAMFRSLLLFATFAFFCVAADAQGYMKPPKEIEDVLNAPAIPQTIVSRARDKILMLTPLRYPPIAELARPMLRIVK